MCTTDTYIVYLPILFKVEARPSARPREPDSASAVEPINGVED